ncbi:hypothetical protein E0Z06_09855 [Rheinheimera sp. D18]|uniref:nucleotidyl transferase AbiEii/AbiGii toxin family protein n=1 Tax=Rheinheimera sp. D18 TaxID=2545632 RepID=UPI00104D21CC|nr:nucleotidyl transferase AbiEii/AbiGii toxin family protein [Rheinheimera sp. D18]QBL09800.1 hypothetical protein E0Z06_09855 [Rheinheimera sp. D18]
MFCSVNSRCFQNQLIATCLHNFNSDYLKQHNILFGGGTRIALELNEYRESIDIDFLCKDRAAYRAVRQQVSSNSLGDLVKIPFSYPRDIRCQLMPTIISILFYQTAVNCSHYVRFSLPYLIKRRYLYYVYTLRSCY